MLQHVELDPTFSLSQQFADPSDETVILVNVFDVDPADQSEFKQAWLTDAKFFDAHGCISAQLH